MNIFDRRPLSLILCLAMWSFVFFTFTSSIAVKIIALCIPIIIFVLSFVPKFVLLLKSSKAYLITLSAVLLFSAIFSFVYFDLWFYPAKRFEGAEVTLNGTVVDRDDLNTEAFTLKTTGINGEPFSSYYIRFYLDTEKYPSIDVGSVVEFTCVLKDFEDSANGFSTGEYYTARGISAYASELDGISHLRKETMPLKYRITLFRRSIAKFISDSTAPDSGGLLGALLLGEKEYLSPSVELNFKRLGITHILALSGMHLVMLSAAISAVLKLLRLGKRASTVITLIFAVLYTVLTGMSLSILRAAIMLLITGILYLISQTHDSITALFISVAAIIIFQPYAVYDMALWLSALATLGILALNEYNRENEKEHTVLRGILNSLLASLFAISATFTLSVLKFNETSLLAAPATLVYSVLTEIFLYAGILHIPLSLFLPTGDIIGAFGSFINSSIAWLADIDVCCISVNFTSVRIMSLIFAALFFGFLIFKTRYKKQMIALISCVLISIYAVAAVLSINVKNTEEIKYISGETESILISGGGETMLVDIGSHSQISAYETTASLSKMNLTSIGTYAFMNYSDGIDNCIETLLGDIKIHKILLPVPKNESEQELYEQAKSIADAENAELLVFEDEDVLRISSVTVVPCITEEYDEDMSVLIALFAENKLYTYVNPSALTGKAKAAALDMMCNSDTVIIGRRGVKEEFVFKYTIDGIERLILGSSKAELFPETVEFYDGRTEIIANPEKAVLY